jgi:drug/metabolite transporter (DMT)-like permease
LIREGVATTRRFDLIGTLALAANVVFWGCTPVLLKELTGHVEDGWTANGLRYPLAAVLYWPVLFSGWRSGRLDRRLLGRAMVPASLAMAGQIFWALSPYYVGAITMGFLIKGAVVWGIVGAMVLFPEERPLLRSKRFYGGLALAAAGVVALSVAQGALEDRVTGLGVLFLLACSLFFGLYGVSVRYTMSGVHPLLAFAVVSQCVAAGTLTLMVLWGDPGAALDLPPEGWALVAASSLLGIATSHVFYYVALLRLGASLATSMHLVGPFVTLAAASIFLGESMGAFEWGAGLVLIAGGGLLLAAQEKLRLPAAGRGGEMATVGPPRSSSQP